MRVPSIINSFRDFRLSPGEIHIWWANLDEYTGFLSQWTLFISKQEKLRSEHFLFERDRNRYILRTGLLRIILGCYLRIDPQEVQFRTSIKGKPSLVDDINAEMITFNVSHSSGMFICACACNLSIGVDIEKIHHISDIDGIVQRFFSPQEINDYFLTPESARTETFFRCWTRKEAFLKATGEGLYRPLNSFTISLLQEESPQISEGMSDPKLESMWHITDINIKEDYATAIVLEGQDSNLHCRNWLNDYNYRN